MISVIIPTLNEEQHLGLLLQQLHAQTDVTVEIIVADGGSPDATIEVAEQWEAIIVSAPRCRGAQMNKGAEKASGQDLLFLHADTEIPNPSTLRNAEMALHQTKERSSTERVAGHFRLCFTRQQTDISLAYRFYEAKTELNRKDTTNGDQGVLLSREFFEELGGFDESMSFLEDQKFAAKVHQRGLWITLPGTLRTSARRFEEEGLARRMILSAVIMGLHNIGFQLFFERAKEVYPEQNKSNQLQLTPYFGLIHELFREVGWRENVRNWIGIGRYVRQNSWQIGFFVDLCLEPWIGRKRKPFTTFCDRVFLPLTNFKPFDAITAVLTYLWFLLSWGYFALAEKKTASTIR